MILKKEWYFNKRQLKDDKNQRPPPKKKSKVKGPFNCQFFLCNNR